jgi:hypothetical protein
MLHPLALDLLASFLPLGFGALAFFAGRSLVPSSKPFKATVLIVIIGIIILVTLSLVGILPFITRSILSTLGGGTTVLCWTAVFLLGYATGSPRRTVSKSFLIMLVVIVAGILVIEGNGRLWWRFAAIDAWKRTTDPAGGLAQSSGWTCSPAAAVMLLHHHGIRSSEGEMAYLANTTLFGTDGFDLASALEEKIRDRGWRARIQETDYRTSVTKNKPFVAHVSDPKVGAHAVFIAVLAEDHAEMIDPLVGWKTQVSRAQFEQIWDGTAIWIDADRGTP